MERHITKEVQIGNRWIGGNHPIAIQSMTNTKTEDVAATVAQIKQLTKVGCEIIRCAVPTQEAAAALTEIKKQISFHSTLEGALQGYSNCRMADLVSNVDLDLKQVKQAINKIKEELKAYETN